MIKKIFKLLEKKEKKIFLSILFLNSLKFFLEFLSLASLPVFVTFIIDPNIIFEKASKILFFDNLIKLEKNELIMKFGFFIILIFFIKNTFFIFMTFYESYFYKRLKLNVSNKLYEYFIYKPYLEISKENPAKISRVIISDVQGLFGFIQNYLNLCQEIIALIVIFFILFIASPISALLGFLFFLIFSLIYLKKTRPFLKTIADKNLISMKDIIKRLNETFGSIKDLKIFQKEKEIKSIFKSEVNVLENNLFYIYIIQKIPKIFLELISIIFIVVLALIYLNYSNNFQELFPLLSLFVILILRFIPAFNSITLSLSYLKIFQPSVKYILDEIKPVFAQTQNYKNSEEIKKKLDFNMKKFINCKNLSFSFPNKKDKIIDNFNFEIQKGDKIAIIGKTGSGKTTLLNILMGLIAPDEGKIYFNNLDIFKDLNNWRKNISFVSQDPYLLDDTIKKNITFDFFDTKMDEKKLVKSVKIADLFRKIDNLPDKFNTIVGNEGSFLSGGEKQRIAIARALYNNRNIIFMDEFTSALDKETEEKIMTNIVENFSEKTIIMVSHKEGILKYCNKVFKIENSILNIIKN